MSENCRVSFEDEDSFSPTYGDESDAVNAAVNGETSLAFDNPDPPTPFPELTLREFLSQFNTDTHTLSANASLTKRPDAVSFDYLVAFSVGPVALGDSSEGAASYIWRARADNEEGKVYLCRQNASNTAWEDEVELFSYTGEAKEIDLAFEQAGRAVVCMEIDGHVYLYWYDSSVSDFVFTDFGTGRTPRVLLDNPEDTTDSDVLFFYINDIVDLVQFRQQRDRYEIVYDTPIVDVEHKYLEDVFRATDLRLVVLYSIHVIETGRYVLGRLESTLYPQVITNEALSLGVTLLASDLVVILQEYNFELESLSVTCNVIDGTLESTSIIYEFTFAPEEESLTLAATVLNGTLSEPVILYTAEVEPLELGASIISGELIILVITHTLYDKDSLRLGATIRSGTLA